MSKSSFKFTSDIPPGSTIAVGDIHACYAQLTQFVEWVKGSDARVVLLGDLIDRSKNPGDDLRVLELVRELCEDPDKFGLASCTSVVGNHEILFLDALDGYGYRDWVSNGGSVADMNDMEAYADWLRSLPYYVTVGDTLFTHSGGVFGKNPADFMNSYSNREAFVWSRTAPKKGAGLSRWSQTLKKSVFGHTPKSAKPYRVGDSVCIDSGGYHFGVLTAYNATFNTFNQFEAE